MRYLKESKEVDLFVDPQPLTAEERNRISQAISHFQNTGEKSEAKKKETSSKSKLKVA
jgi:hypothetical protein